MTTAPIYHICRRDEWEKAQASGRYGGSTQDVADGFIHFSTAAQVAESAARHRAGQRGLVLLAVDAEARIRKYDPDNGEVLWEHALGDQSTAPGLSRTGTG